MRYWMVLALSIACLTAYAEEKQFVPLPKASSQEVSQTNKHHVFMLIQGTEASQVPDESTTKPMFKQVRCNLSSRYRSCF